MIDVGTWVGPVAYGAVFLAAAIEGEVVFVAASALVAAGQLNGLGVWLAGACGAATGDQFWYHVLRAGHSWWLSRRSRLDADVEGLQAWALRYRDLLVFAIRFLPGFRIAATGVCVVAGISPVRFCVLNVVSACLWAAIVLGLVAWVGPAVLGRSGLAVWSGALAAGVVCLLVFRWIGAAIVRPRSRPRRAE